MNRLRFSVIITGILLPLAVFFGGRQAFAQSGTPPRAEPVVLTDEQGAYPLGLYMDILEDPTRKLTVEDVSSPAYNNKFFASQSQVPIFGFTDSAYWVRITVRNETRNHDDWLIDVLYSNMQYVDFYTPLPNGEGFTVKQSGSLRPPETRDLHYPRVIFTYTLSPGEQNTIYLRFQSGTSMTLNLTLWRNMLFIND